MINVAYILISPFLLSIGFAFDNLILVLKSFLGFTVVFLSISFFEYSMAKSIIKDLTVIYVSRTRRHKRKAQIKSKVEFVPVLASQK